MRMWAEQYCFTGCRMHAAINIYIYIWIILFFYMWALKGRDVRFRVWLDDTKVHFSVHEKVMSCKRKITCRTGIYVTHKDFTKMDEMFLLWSFLRDNRHRDVKNNNHKMCSVFGWNPNNPAIVRKTPVFFYRKYIHFSVNLIRKCKMSLVWSISMMCLKFPAKTENNYVWYFVYTMSSGW